MSDTAENVTEFQPAETSQGPAEGETRDVGGVAGDPGALADGHGTGWCIDAAAVAGYDAAVGCAGDLPITPTPVPMPIPPQQCCSPPFPLQPFQHHIYFCKSTRCTIIDKP